MDKYRKNVGVVIFNKTNKVLMCARADMDDMQWQFPQGGIDENENIIDAAKRELQEETAITSVEFITVLPTSLIYNYPPELLERKMKDGKSYLGQEQFWVLFSFFGEDDEINFFTNPEEVEFKAFQWIDIEDAPKHIVSFKKDVYNKVKEAFAPYIKRKNCQWKKKLNSLKKET